MNTSRILYLFTKSLENDGFAEKDVNLVIRKIGKLDDFLLCRKKTLMEATPELVKNWLAMNSGHRDIAVIRRFFRFAQERFNIDSSSLQTVLYPPATIVKRCATRFEEPVKSFSETALNGDTASLLKEFGEHMKDAGYAPATIKKSFQDLRIFAKFLAVHRGNLLTVQTCKYSIFMKKCRSQYSVMSSETMFAVLRKFYSFLWKYPKDERITVKIHEILLVKPPVVKKQYVKWLSHDDIDAILKSKLRANAGKRSLAIMALIYGCSLTTMEESTKTLAAKNIRVLTYDSLLKGAYSEYFKKMPEKGKLRSIIFNIDNDDDFNEI